MSAWGFKAGVRKLGARRGGAAESEVAGSCGGGIGRQAGHAQEGESAGQSSQSDISSLSASGDDPSIDGSVARSDGDLSDNDLFDDSCGRARASGVSARTPAECESAASARDTGARLVIPGGSACKRLLSDSDSSDELEDLTEDTGARRAAAEGAVGANGKGKAVEDQTEDMGGARGAAEKGAAVAKGKGTVPKARKRARKVITIEDGDDVEALSDTKKRQGLGWEVLDWLETGGAVAGRPFEEDEIFLHLQNACELCRSRVKELLCALDPGLVRATPAQQRATNAQRLPAALKILLSLAISLAGSAFQHGAPEIVNARLISANLLDFRDDLQGFGAPAWLWHNLKLPLRYQKAPKKSQGFVDPQVLCCQRVLRFDVFALLARVASAAVHMLCCADFHPLPHSSPSRFVPLKPPASPSC